MQLNFISVNSIRNFVNVHLLQTWVNHTTLISLKIIVDIEFSGGFFIRRKLFNDFIWCYVSLEI
jgi:hypothetical protein